MGAVQALINVGSNLTRGGSPPKQQALGDFDAQAQPRSNRATNLGHKAPSSSSIATAMYPPVKKLYATSSVKVRLNYVRIFFNF